MCEKTISICANCLHNVDEYNTYTSLKMRLIQFVLFISFLFPCQYTPRLLALHILLYIQERHGDKLMLFICLGAGKNLVGKEQ